MISYFVFPHFVSWLLWLGCQYQVQVTGTTHLHNNLQRVVGDVKPYSLALAHTHHRITISHSSLAIISVAVRGYWHQTLTRSLGNPKVQPVSFSGQETRMHSPQEDHLVVHCLLGEQVR